MVEFAVCLPMLMVLMLGSIEATSAIFLKQSLVAAAYEGVREAVGEGEGLHWKPGELESLRSPISKNTFPESSISSLSSKSELRKQQFRSKSN